VDVVIELASEDDAGLLSSLATLREGGLLVAIAGDLGPEVSAAAADQGKRAVEILVSPDRAGLESLAALADEGALTVVVDRTLPLTEAAEAHGLLESGRVKGKVVLTV
jgi:NADPH:quinone reductase-like Zn-dependent oxidoreductase